MDKWYIIEAIIAMAAATYLTRLIPFVMFVKHKPPQFVLFLEKWLPPAMMTILVFYSLKSTDFQTPPYGGYEIGAVVFTVALHLIFKNYLLSIFGGTLFYMAIVQEWIAG